MESGCGKVPQKVGQLEAMAITKGFFYIEEVENISILIFLPFDIKLLLSQNRCPQIKLIKISWHIFRNWPCAPGLLGVPEGLWLPQCKTRVH